MINILICTILIIPWLILPFPDLPEPTRLIKSTFFDISMMAIIVFGIKNGIKFEYRNKYICWFSACVFTSIVFNWYYPIVRGFGYNAGTIDASIHFMLALFATFLICSIIERSDFVRIAKAIVISSSLVAIFCFFQFFGLDPFKNMAHYKVTEVRHIAAMLDHPDLVGNYLALSIPFFLYLKGARYKICLAIVLLMLLIVKSSLSIGAAFVGGMIYLILVHRNSKFIKTILTCIVMIFIAFCFVHKGFNKTGDGFTGRVPAWKEFIKRDDNYLFGRGLGIAKSYQIYFADKNAENSRKDIWVFCHNDYLEIFLALGAIGLFLFLLIVINAIRNFSFNINNRIGFSYLGSFIVFLILMIGSFPMEIAPLALGGLVAFWGVTKT